MTGGRARLADRLRAFFFRPVPASSLGAMRIGIGLLCCLWLAMLVPDLDLLLSPRGVVSLEAVDQDWHRHRFSLYDHVADDGQLLALHLAGLGVAVLYTLGLATPVTGPLLLLVLVSVLHRDPWIQNGGDRTLRIMLLYMVLAPTGRALSLDAALAAWRRRRRGLQAAATPVVSGVVLRIVQAQLVVIYTYTGIAKSFGSTWRDGTALYYALSNEYYARAPALFDQLLAQRPVQLVTSLATWVTLGWEILFLPLVAWRRTRVPALVVGIVLHAVIWSTMSVGMFSLVMLWAYLAFLPPDWVERLRGRRA